MDVAGFPNRFCILLDFYVWVGLATTGHIRSLMIFSVHVISFVFLLSKYTNSMKVSNQNLTIWNRRTVHVLAIARCSPTIPLAS